MNLIQILDPIKAKSEDSVVGIDFGTTNSLISYSIDQKPYVLDGGFLPSVLSYKNGDWFVGNIIPDAINIRSIKRILGKTYEEIILNGNTQEFLVNVNGQSKFHIDGTIYDPVDLAALIFVKLKQIAENSLGEVKRAVVTVPAYFDDKQKTAVKKGSQEAKDKMAKLRAMRKTKLTGGSFKIN